MFFRCRAAGIFGMSSDEPDTGHTVAGVQPSIAFPIVGIFLAMLAASSATKISPKWSRSAGLPHMFESELIPGGITVEPVIACIAP